jgi:hypothetical protein
MTSERKISVTITPAPNPKHRQIPLPWSSPMI